MGMEHQGRGMSQVWRGIVVILAVLLVASVEPGHARGGHGFGGHHGFRGHHGFGGFHGFRGHHGFRGPSVFLGVGPYWGPYWDPYIYPPVVVATPPTVYVEPPTPEAAPPPATYWYYCNDPQGYYPYVTQCPGGWRPVVPTPP
jgi:hypothetical protein